MRKLRLGNVKWPKVSKLPLPDVYYSKLGTWVRAQDLDSQDKLPQIY